MTSFWQILIVVLLAVLVVAVVPVLVQLKRTLRQAEDVLRTAGPKLDRTLDEAGEAANRINRLGEILERDAEGLRVFTDAASGLGRSLRRVQESVHAVATVGSALGPAVAAGIRSLFSPERDEQRPSPRSKAAPAPREDEEDDGSSLDPREPDLDAPGGRGGH